MIHEDYRPPEFLGKQVEFVVSDFLNRGIQVPDEPLDELGEGSSLVEEAEVEYFSFEGKPGRKSAKLGGNKGQTREEFKLSGQLAVE